MNNKASAATAGAGEGSELTEGPSNAGLTPEQSAKMADSMARTQGKLPANMAEEEKKELMEVMKLAAQMEKAEEEAML